jgi:hypothetical protein
MINHDKDHVSALFDVKVIGEDGSVVQHVSGESDSFVQNFILLLQAAFRNSAVSMQDTSNTARSALGFSSYPTAYGVTNSHVVVGTGSTPVTPSDYKLESQNLTLEHVPVLLTQPTTPVINGGFIESTMFRRTFNNRTGASVVISEIGVYVLYSSYSIMILRDILGSPVTVLNNQTLQVEYTIRTAI